MSKFAIRNPYFIVVICLVIAVVSGAALFRMPGASVPQPFGGRYRQIMVYADPTKLQAYQMSPMDLVRTINESNLILPAGDVQLGPLDYNIYTNAQVSTIADLANMPVKTVGVNPVRVSDVATSKDAFQIQTNVVRVDNQCSVYVPVLKQGGDTNTIAVVNGVRETIRHLFDIPKELVTNVVFDQSRFVKTAIETLLHEGGMGLFLTSLMILIFLGSFRATLAVFFSIPLSALATFMFGFHQLINQPGSRGELYGEFSAGQLKGIDRMVTADAVRRYTGRPLSCWGSKV